jgi:hypothetical protein
MQRIVPSGGKNVHDNPQTEDFPQSTFVRGRTIDDETRDQSKRLDRQVISRQRVTEVGEVLTGKREVKAMLDLVQQETERIESRFLEPACGNGNFLAEILERKLRVVEKRYARSQLEYERYAILAVSSIYGIDILEDNVHQCRRRLFGVFDENYSRLFTNKTQHRCREAVWFILKQNITWGDALTLKTVGEEPEYIVFSEWSLVNGSTIKRRDFTFHGLFEHEGMKELPLFSDLGEDVFIPTPKKEYPPATYAQPALDRDIIGSQVRQHLDGLNPSRLSRSRGRCRG